jgi:hypothetical protein
MKPLKERIGRFSEYEVSQPKRQGSKDGSQDIEFSTGNGLKDFLVIVSKQVKAFIGSVIFDNGFLRFLLAA